MPDIDFQRIELNLIPKKGEQPVVFYASQYETARPFIADLKWGNTEFAPGDDCWAEIDIRKNDDNLVVITDDVTIDNNEVSVILPVQALTCIGKNLGQVKIYAADDQLIAALNFILEVQADPSAGGVTSETAIDNLTQQIEDIAQEVIGDDYYNKTEVDTLLADKADVSDLPDMSLYYTKTATDTLLNAKADKSDTYTKAHVDSALAAKANSADLAAVATSGDYDDLINKPTIPAAQVQSDYAQADNTQVDYIKNKPDISGMIADALLAVMPVETVGPSAVCNFNTDIATNLVNVKCTIEASGGGGTPSTPIPIVGHSAVNLTYNGTTDTIALGSTVYGGELDVTSGVLTDSFKNPLVDLGSLTWFYSSGSGLFYSYGINNAYAPQGDNTYIANAVCDCYKVTSRANLPNNNYHFSINYSDAVYLSVRNTDYTDTAAFKAAMNGHYLTYELATPQTVQLTAQQVQAILGDNNVFCDTGDITNLEFKESLAHKLQRS